MSPDRDRTGGGGAGHDAPPPAAGATTRRLAQVPRSTVVNAARLVGGATGAAQAAQMLPDPVDLDRDGALLSRLGVAMDQLVQQMGGSP